jgi:hypothetical protein
VSSFTDAFERLVVLLRETPRDGAAHGAAAAEAAATVAIGGERVEAGVEGSEIALDTTLQGRMLARAVDWIEVDARATIEDLANVARALASDDLPVPHTRSVRVALIPLPIVDPAPILRSLTPALGVPALGATDEVPDPQCDRLTADIAEAVGRRAWSEALGHAHALLEYADASPADRRARIIAGRRVLPRPAL